MKNNFVSKNSIPWLKYKKFKLIHKVIVKIFYKKYEKIKTSDFKNNLKLDKNLSPYVDFIYEFKDNYGSWLDHMVRNCRFRLEKEKFLYKLNDGKGYKATKKLLKDNLEKEIEIYNLFLNYLKNINVTKKKFDNFKLLIQNISIKNLTEFVNQQKITSIKNNSYIFEQNKDVKKLRNKFVNNLNEEFDYFKTKNIIRKYAKTFDSNNKMNFVDNAHIVPVWYLIKNKRYNDIVNPNNGLILDPNTHRIFDKDKDVEISKDYSIIFNNHISFNINKIFLNDERIKFLKEWKILKKNQQI